MRLHASKIPHIVNEMVHELTTSQLIEVSPANVSEVELDVESVLKEYLRADRQLTEEAKDLVHQRGLEYSAFQKVKRQLADRRRFGIHDEAVEYLSNQLIETFLHTRHVEEVFGADHEIRAAIAPILRRNMTTVDPLNEEVRKRIKNLQEGTQDWEIQYQQTLERLRRLRGMTP